MTIEIKENLQIRNFQRRKFLKYSLIAGGGFLVGKFLNSALELFFSKRMDLMGHETSLLTNGQTQTKTFQNFVVQETDRQLNFFDRNGHEILVIEK